MSFRTSFWLCAVVIASMVSARAANPDVATATRNEATVIGFVAGAPLTPAEQATVAQYVAGHFASEPKVEASNAGGAAFAATVIAGNDARKRAIIREMYRTEIEGRDVTDPERGIIEAHDPAIAYDAKNKFVVTEHTLNEVMAATIWATHVLGVPPPSPDLRADARSVLAEKFVTFDHANQEAYAHIERNIAVALPILGHDTPAAQKAALLRWGKPDSGHGLLKLTTAALEMTAFQAESGGGGSRFGNPALQILHGMTMRNMAQSTWQMRHPECGPVGSNPSSCSEAPIFQPVAPPFP